MTELDKAFENLYSDHPDGREAESFLKHYNMYCHVIDDLIDEDGKNPEYILGMLHLALQIYSSNFYRKYQDVLYPVINIIHNTYADSVIMEHSGEQWQKECADVLRSVGQEMALVVIQILGGYKARRNLSLKVREFSYKSQHEIKDIT